MSLINKMLQDLDARGGAGARAGGEAVRPVAAAGGQSRAVMALRTGVALTALALALWYGWSEWRKGHAPAPAGPAAAKASGAGGVAAGGAAVSGAPVAAAGAAAGAQGGAGAPAAGPSSAAPGAGPAGEPQRAGQGAAPAGVAPTTSMNAALAESRAERAERIAARHQREAAAQQAPADLAAQLEEARRKARDARAEAKALAASHAGAADAKAARGANAEAGAAPARVARAQPQAAPPRQREPEAAGVTVTSQQQADNAYKRALGALQDGRVQDAMANLEQAVYAYPRHDAARQALVGLLLEARRHDEAMRHLQLGLGLDPKQQQMAMLLARLQIERGGPAVETLMRTLPHAGNNPDYLAFLAGALQKAQRHREAVEQYQAALRLMPQNGVWWMGMGISLQADKRNAEAIDAYNRAKAGGSLSPELASYVERRLAQLAR